MSGRWFYKLGAYWFFPDPDPPTISILYKLFCCVFSSITSSKLIIIFNFLFSDIFLLKFLIKKYLKFLLLHEILLHVLGFSLQIISLPNSSFIRAITFFYILP